MNLRNREFKNVYIPRADPGSVVEEFLIPALHETATYKRVSGYFSSAVFAEAAEGIGALLENNGRMQLVTSHSLTPRDASQLEKFLEDDEFAEALIRNFQADFAEVSNLEEMLAADHLKAMCWMLGQGYLEVKVVIPRQAKVPGNLGDYEKFHPKFGIFEDAQGNKVVFSGSLNETFSGWFKNVENICVYKSWVPGLEDYIAAYDQQFDAYWNNDAGQDWLVIPLPEAVKLKMIELTGADEFPETMRRDRNSEKRGLRKYQNAAVDAWIANGYRGILEMATGTGKTRTAVACIREAEQINDSLLVVVVAPYQHIAEQWLVELGDYDPYLASSTTRWRESAKQARLDLQLGHKNVVVFITVKNTGSSEDFISEMAALASFTNETMFIGDEVHWLGAGSLQSSLIGFANYRLGLSATPKRYFDDEGSSVLIGYFSDVIYRFGLNAALNWVDEKTGQTVLCNYEYHPIFVEFTDDELNDYKDKSKALARAMSGEMTPEKIKQAELLRLLRADIGKAAAEKIPAFGVLLEMLDQPITYTIIYCADTTQMEKVAAELRQHGIDYQKITGEESTAKTKKYNGKSERSTILKNFEDGRIDILLAIDCLDEGVDIPAAKQAIILASSGNPKEFIQRRGRIMRQFPGKTKAVIYDFVVTAPEAEAHKDTDLLRVYQVELDRISDFAADALNKKGIMELLKNMGHEGNEG